MIISLRHLIYKKYISNKNIAFFWIGGVNTKKTFMLMCIIQNMF